MEHSEPSWRSAEHPRPDHFLVHLSDTHLVGEGELYDAVDSEERVRQIFAELAESGARPEALVFTGDLADRGEPAAYESLRALVQPAADAVGATLVWAMGNHDDRAAFRTRLLDEPPSTDPVDRVVEIGGLRVITLDSTVPGHHHGELTDDQLQWLAAELSVPAPHGTVLAMHHPPVPCVQDLAVLVELRGQRALADVLRGTDVRAILAGHLHYSTSAVFAGIPVSVASATCYTQDLNVPVGAQRGRDAAQAYNLIHVYGDGRDERDTVVHSVVPISTGDTVGTYVSADETERRLAEAGVVIADASASTLTSQR